MRARPVRLPPLIISGLGGGMIRDVLRQHSTPVALTDFW
ncbi:TRIC cation channel family protein [Streptomyces sp. KL116D]